MKDSHRRFAKQGGWKTMGAEDKGRRRMRVLGVVVAMAVAVTAASARAQGCEANDPATSVRGASGGCFSFHAAHVREGAPLVVFLHGDGGGSVGESYWQALTAGAAAAGSAVGATFVVLVRPGYRSPGGRSTGSAKSEDDDYTAQNVALAAEAVTALKARFRPSRTIVSGTSGGAATAALLMGRHPGVADAALLAACPCQLQPWREWRAQSANRTRPWTSSLSPDAALSGMAVTARIALVVGDKDTNTLPKFSEAYVAAAKARGIDATLTVVPGATHGSAWRSPAYVAALKSVLR